MKQQRNSIFSFHQTCFLSILIIRVTEKWMTKVRLKSKEIFCLFLILIF